jgi:hypothetical protein
MNIAGEHPLFHWEKVDNDGNFCYNKHQEHNTGDGSMCVQYIPITDGANRFGAIELLNRFLRRFGRLAEHHIHFVFILILIPLGIVRRGKYA